MLAAAEDALSDTLAQVLALAQGGGHDPQLAEFVRRFYSHAAPQDLDHYGPEALFGIAAAVWKVSAERAGGKRVVAAAPAPQPITGETLIVAINDDKPFLYDSTMAELNAQGLRVKAAFHPIIYVRRDGQWRRIALSAPPEGGEAFRESYICVTIEDPGAEARGQIAPGLNTVYDDVDAAVRDWRGMLGKADDSIAELRRNPPPIAPADLEESIAFLAWLRDNNFTFLGMRDYALTSDGDMVLQPLVETGLGILSDPERRVIRSGTSRTSLTPEEREFLLQPQPLIITKGAVRSTVHRRVHQDYVGIKRFDGQGNLAGERRFVGLFTSNAYSHSPTAIPLLRRKARYVMDRSGFAPQSHSGKALANVLETYPRDELFQITNEELYENALGILHIMERPQTRVFLRFDKFDRFVSALVFLPRERFGSDVLAKAAQILAARLDGRVSAVYPHFDDAAVARAHIIIARHPGERPSVDLAALDAEIARAARDWSDNLQEALIAARKSGARTLARRYAHAFDAAYRDTFTPEQALSDLPHVEALTQGNAPTGAVVVDAYRLPQDGAQDLRLKLFVAQSQADLSACLPVLENFGLRVISERSFRITPASAGAHGFVTLHDFRAELQTTAPIDLAANAAIFQDAFRAVWTGAAENDGFNRLTLSAGLPAREVTALRAIAKYLRQAGIAFSQAYMEEALARNADIAGKIAELFTHRFDPALDAEARRHACETLNARIDAALGDVSSLDEDRILRRFRNAVMSCLRTTYFQTQADGAPRPVLAFKFDSQALDDLPAPRPLYEIFVFSPRLEGVHLRFGKVARGGLRWSDRREDFRTEILGLVKAQQVKNAVIVPVGAKGGFYPKQMPVNGTREEAQAEGVAAYRLFISALLDLTDNIAPSGAIVPPPRTVREDGDDPYLVVAADKGTATFSDIANGIAIERGFWLGDAFASGGSKGYDHKKMGITARGAWEAVKRHFREMGRDTQAEPFTVVGVGDMSGDVFGNGMLLSEQIRLVAAFDHRHIFIDPEPDAARSFAERKRLFDLPRSSWADYDKSLISAGGGVFSRTAKSVPLSPAMQALTGLSEPSATPQELMRALLKAECDLLWFGGIGTYIKASTQAHAEAGDRANDAIRVDGKDLRAKVVGEGANLGCTQAARIEFARKGGRINTDAIDNSAGVDTSDHEVNLKILLNAAVAAGRLSVEGRDALLADLTEEVGQLVLADNYEQTLALSIAEASAATDLDDYARLMRDLERRGRLDRGVEGLPSDEALHDLAQDNQGLTRPELAVLLAYAKLSLFDDLIASPLPDDPVFADLIAGYFPKAVARDFAGLVPQHRLKREIAATVLGNSLINAGGPAFINRLREASGADAASIARAAFIAREAYRIPSLYERINALDGSAGAAVQVSMHQDIITLLTREALWVLRHVPPSTDIGETATLYRRGIDSLRGTFSTLVSAVEAQGIEARIGELKDAGVPMDLAEDVAVAPVLGAVTDIIRIANAADLTVEAVAGAFFEAGETVGIDRLRAATQRVAARGHWDRLALQRVGDDLLSAQRSLASKALRHASETAIPVTREDGVAAVGAWAESASESLERARGLVGELERSGPFTIAKLTIAAGQLRDLAGA